MEIVRHCHWGFGHDVSRGVLEVIQGATGSVLPFGVEDFVSRNGAVAVKYIGVHGFILWDVGEGRIHDAHI